MTDPDLEYFAARMQAAVLTPLDLDPHDENLTAFRSPAQFVGWYGQPPIPDGLMHYRDRGFYVRELAHVSRTIRPRTIVEFGTSLGIGTCLLRWLNPDAQLTTVDLAGQAYLPGDRPVPIGHIAKRQSLRGVIYRRGVSWEHEQPGVDLCFIDGSHEYEAVLADSARAWANHSQDHAWAIVWHDHNERHPGVMRAVAEFCQLHQIALQQREDSDTVWISNAR